MKCDNEVICYVHLVVVTLSNKVIDKWGGKATFKINGVLGGLRVGFFLAIQSHAI